RLEDKVDFLSAAKQLYDMGFSLFATQGTSEFLTHHGIKNTHLYKVSKKKKPNILNHLAAKKIDLVIDIPKNYTREEITDGYTIRRTAIDMNVQLITNVQVAKLIVEALQNYKIDDLAIKRWDEYLDA
ncbi:carbamoyl phosphate synthase large subunit, partial [Candidatus Peregrinibacteria bacterium]|nr:carbamoyl phosphate synthase large subunit [Candidatus Peregrinibacteria bacterium]